MNNNKCILKLSEINYIFRCLEKRIINILFVLIMNLFLVFQSMRLLKYKKNDIFTIIILIYHRSIGWSCFKFTF